jgi:hypothetical protein
MPVEDGAEIRMERSVEADTRDELSGTRIDQ